MTKRSVQPIVAVLCDRQCSPQGPIRAERLKSLLEQDGGIEELVLLEKACQDPRPHLTGLAGKRVLFGGCPYLEESGFYSAAVQSLGLRTGEFIIGDLKSSVFDLYDKPKAMEENLLRQLRCLCRLLSAKEPAAPRPARPKRHVLVVGSGLSALKAALELDGEKLAVDLVETGEPPLGPGCLAVGLSEPDLVERLRAQARESGQIAFVPHQNVLGIEAGEKGFALTMAGGEAREYGAVIFAPERTEEDGVEPGALSLSGLYERLAEGRALKGRIVFLLDREVETRPEVLQDVLAAALAIKRRFSSEVWVLLRQVPVALPGLEELYSSSRESGIVFLKYDQLSVTNDFGDFELRGRDLHSGAAFLIDRPQRLVVPGRPGLGAAARRLAAILGLRLSCGAYTQPDSLWPLPNSSNRPGVLVAGSARGNMDACLVSRDAAAAAAMLRERFAPQGLGVVEHVAVVDEERCAYCLTCLRICPFGAVTKDTVRRAAAITATACQGCGICAAACPAEAIELRNLAKDDILSGLQALM